MEDVDEFFGTPEAQKLMKMTMADDTAESEAPRQERRCERHPGDARVRELMAQVMAWKTDDDLTDTCSDEFRPPLRMAAKPPRENLGILASDRGR